MDNGLKIEQKKRKKSEQRTTYPPVQRLLSLKDAAVYMGRSSDSLRELLYRREFKCLQEGERGKIWIDRLDLDAWIESKKDFM